MRVLIFIFAMLLAACGGVEQTSKRVPSEVRAEADQVVDEVMSGDLSAVREAFPDAEGEQFESFIERSRSAVREGTERARNLVGVQVGRGDGGVSYRLAHEVETDAGFTVISQTYGGPNGETPILRAIEVNGSDSSLAAQQRRLGMATRLIFIALLLGVLLSGFLFLRVRRRSHAA